MPTRGATLFQLWSRGNAVLSDVVCAVASIEPDEPGVSAGQLVGNLITFLNHTLG